MPCEIMIYKSSRSFRNDAIQKGDIVCVKDLPHSGWGKKEAFSTVNNFVFLRVLDCNKEDVLQYTEPYKMNVAYEKLGQNLFLDGHRFKLYSNKSRADEPSLTLDKVEKYFNRHNIVLNEATDNSIIVDVVIFDVINNFRFWNITAEQFDFLDIEELAYNRDTGDHSIRISEAKSGVLNAKALNYIVATIAERGGSVTQTNLVSRYIEILINRDAILSYLKAAIKEDVESIHLVRLRKYAVKEAVVDQLINYSNTNNGEAYQATKQQVLQNVVDLSI